MSLALIQHLKKNECFNRSLAGLRGLGRVRLASLKEHGIETRLDLLSLLPYQYQDRSAFVPLGELRGGEEVYVRGRIISSGEEKARRSGRYFYKIRLRDETGELEMIWFNYNRFYLKGLSVKGSYVCAFGRVSSTQAVMIHPEVSGPFRELPQETQGIVPVYRPVSKVGSKVIKALVEELLDECLSHVKEPLPVELLEEVGLPGLPETLDALHRPRLPQCDVGELKGRTSPYHRRLLFNRFFVVMLLLEIRRASAGRIHAPVMKTPPGLRESIERAFSFKLTEDQNTVLQEIAGDLEAGRPMNRLVVGDVGCGKTALAASAAFIAAKNGWQTAIMVPTRVLAVQHFEYFKGLSASLGLSPCLLHAGLKGEERLRIVIGISEGRFDVVIGTHSLMNEGLTFKKLGLVVFDEQHRFGVRQRWRLSGKAENPHVLFVTATPIPRSLALVFFADRDISFIREMPASRKTVRTVLVGQDGKKGVLDSLKKALSRGEQAVFICPLIEETEESDLRGAVETAERLKDYFKSQYSVGLLHGRLTDNEKEAVMERFRKGSIRILVSTTVMEVGVHVPGATMMIIEHPERFGLAQLHQLRGRVGRGGLEGWCFLLIEEGLSEASMQRLKAFCECSDGYEIAKKDLEMRGQGEMAGIRQAGQSDIGVEEIAGESKLFEAAKRWAQRIVQVDPVLSNYPTLRENVDALGN